jgi:hypothetical protein
MVNKLDREVRFDSAMNFYHGGLIRIHAPHNDTNRLKPKVLREHIAVGLAKLQTLPGVEPNPEAPVEVVQVFDVETDDLMVLWRVACRMRGH